MTCTPNDLKTYRYEEINPLVDQFPFAKTGNPAVNRMITHKTRAVGVEYSIKASREHISTKEIRAYIPVHLECQGNLSKPSPCAFMALINLK